MARRAVLGIMLVAALAAATASAAADSRADYLDAVKQARQLVAQAQAGDASAATLAAAHLRNYTNNSQPEVVADLTAKPPKLSDADSRLAALEQELQQPIATPDRGKADRELKSILAEPRYRPGGPNIAQMIQDWILQQLSKLLTGTGTTANIVGLLELTFAAVIAVIVLVLIARALWSRRGGTPLRADAGRIAERAAHSFAEADRLAAAGDYLGAIKALTSAVATTVGGIGTWEASPFTVRELFAERRILDGLRPLVVPFEAAAYGHRVPDAATYDHAAQAAASYRAQER